MQKLAEVNTQIIPLHHVHLTYLVTFPQMLGYKPFKDMEICRAKDQTEQGNPCERVYTGLPSQCASQILLKLALALL